MVEAEESHIQANILCLWKHFSLLFMFTMFYIFFWKLFKILCSLIEVTVLVNVVKTNHMLILYTILFDPKLSDVRFPQKGLKKQAFDTCRWTHFTCLWKEHLKIMGFYKYMNVFRFFKWNNQIQIVVGLHGLFQQSNY